MRTLHQTDEQIEEVLGYLSDLSIFADVDPVVLRNCLQQCDILTLEEGQVLLSPNKVNSHIYILLKGKLSVHLDINDLDPVARIEIGECVGEMSIFEGEMPSAHVIAMTESRLIGIHKEVIWKLIDQSNRLAQNLLHLLLQRIRSGNEALSSSFDKLRAQEVSICLDPLTGIYNRRWLNKMFHREVQRCQKSESKLGLIMIDVDYFKRFNDQNGHLAGDQCLKSIASALRNNLRPNDMVARFGGEEFSVLLPDTLEQDCRMIAERLRKAVSNTTILDHKGNKLPSVTISLGIVQMKPGDNVEDLLEQADKALYEAKERGRNCIVSHK